MRIHRRSSLRWLRIAGYTAWFAIASLGKGTRTLGACFGFMGWPPYFNRSSFARVSRLILDGTASLTVPYEGSDFSLSSLQITELRVISCKVSPRTRGFKKFTKFGVEKCNL